MSSKFALLWMNATMSIIGTCWFRRRRRLCRRSNLHTSHPMRIVACREASSSTRHKHRVTQHNDTQVKCIVQFSLLSATATALGSAVRDSIIHHYYDVLVSLSSHKCTRRFGGRVQIGALRGCGLRVGFVLALRSSENSAKCDSCSNCANLCVALQCEIPSRCRCSQSRLMHSALVEINGL